VPDAIVKPQHPRAFQSVYASKRSSVLMFQNLKEQKMPALNQLNAFVAMVVAGEYVQAIEDFYTLDASMQENQSPPRAGRDVLAAHERAALTRVQSIRTTLAEVLANENDRVVIHWVFEITDGAGKIRILDELAVQEWRDEKIFREQFYYDPAQLKT
jgi:ketosteroid isomerase-like protein